MEKNKDTRFELFFITLDLIDSLEELIVSLNQNLHSELEDQNNSPRHKRVIELIKKEIEITELQIVVSNDEIDEILDEINISDLDKLIKECKYFRPEFIDKLLDIRSEKRNKLF